MHEVTNTEFLFRLRSVLGAEDTLVEKRRDKETCSHEAYVLLGKKDN